MEVGGLVLKKGSFMENIYKFFSVIFLASYFSTLLLEITKPSLYGYSGKGEIDGSITPIILQ